MSPLLQTSPHIHVLLVRSAQRLSCQWTQVSFKLASCLEMGDYQCSKQQHVISENLRTATHPGVPDWLALTQCIMVVEHTYMPPLKHHFGPQVF